MRPRRCNKEEPQEELFRVLLEGIIDSRQPLVKLAESLSGRVLNGDVFVDLGYRGHDYRGPATIHISRTRKFTGRLRRLMKRRNAVEAKFGHMKNNSRLDRNFLLGREGDCINAILCGCGVNLRFLIGEIYQLVSFLLFSALRFYQNAINRLEKLVNPLHLNNLIAQQVCAYR